MAIDYSIDTLINGVVHFFLVSVPTFLIPHALSFYLFCMNFIKFVISQTFRTIKAIIESFMDVTIGFYKNSENTYTPVPFITKNVYNIDPEWLYDISVNSFYHIPSANFKESKNIPFIGASLNFGGHDTIGDMSEWLMDQKIYSNTISLPLQILVSAWRYSFDGVLMTNFENYHLHVITEEGDDIVYDLNCGKEIISIDESESGSGPESDSESGSEQKSEPEEGEIVESTSNATQEA
jgi:hypothetical protein